MTDVRCYTTSGASERTVQLPDEWFAVEVNRHALYQATHAQQVNDRAGTASTKSRAEVRGGGTKPWKQKGTGRARAGSIRSPVWRGGGVAFGPSPKTWHEQVPKKVRRLAFASALTEKANRGELRVVELEAFERPRTAQLARALGTWEVTQGRTLLLTAAVDDNLYRSGRNIARLTVKAFRDASALDILGHDVVIVEDGAWTTRRRGDDIPGVRLGVRDDG